MFGVKNQDLFARDPESGELVLSQKIKSALNVWPVDIVMGKENNSLLQTHLKDLFLAFEEAAANGVRTNFGWQPINNATNADMSVIWKTNDYGCAVKTRGNAKPCHWCLVRNDNLANPCLDKATCRWCTLTGAVEDKERQCYHHRIITEQVAEVMEAELSTLDETFMGMLEEVKQVQSQSVLDMLENPKIATVAATNDSSSIHFAVHSGLPRQVVSEYNAKITHNLELRNMDTSTGNLEERQKQLEARLIEEWTYVRLKSNVEENGHRAAKALFLIMKTVPCILHAENRMGIKIFTMLLIEGLLNALKGALHGERRAADEFVNLVKSVVNSEIFGDTEHEAQWQVPLCNDKKSVGAVCMSNICTRKIIGYLEALIEICVHDDDRKEIWNDCIGNDYRQMVKLLTKHTNLSTDKINKFQRSADNFFDKWVKLHGISGITN
ncbi:hypothetical protein ACA910_008974 [Epithemia clementina (nom. ined.)]